MPDDDQEIVPAEGIGADRLGDSFAAARARLPECDVEERGTTRVLHTRDKSLYFDNDLLTQIGIHHQHPGRTADGLRLHQTLAEVRGELVLDAGNGVLLLAGVPGLCFSLAQDLLPLAGERPKVLVLPASATITWIGVFRPEDADEPLVRVRLAPEPQVNAAGEGPPAARTGKRRRAAARTKRTPSTPRSRGRA